MRRIPLITVGLLATGTYFAVGHFLPKPVPTPVIRLSQFTDRHIDKIFSPISSSEAPIPTHELRMLRESFKDSLARKEGNKQALISAIRLCDTLLLAIRS